MNETNECDGHSTAKCCYPGGDVNSSSTVFLSLYEEEEALECPEDYAKKRGATGGPPCQLLAKVVANRPTIYYVLRLFDSIIGFHKGDLDLSGRHPERYYEMQGQWATLLHAFLALQNQGSMTRPEGRTLVTKPYHYLDSGRWHRFQVKWRLPDSVNYERIQEKIQSVLQVLKQHPVPQFQKTCLVDLPIEVLDSVFGFASTARSKLLSCTCRKLNSIGQRHIFQTWYINFHVPSDITALNVQYSTIDMPTLAYFSSEDLERNADFVKSTPHIASRIQKLVFSDEWAAHRRNYLEPDNPFKLSRNFYENILQSFSSVLKASTQISSLVLNNININIDLCRMVADNPTIHTLELHLCYVAADVRARALVGLALPCRQIANLHIYMDCGYPESCTQWYILLVCPQIRTLSMVQTGVNLFTTLEPSFWKKLHLDNLERLALDNIFVGDLINLTQRLVTQGTPFFHLTHFKLHMDWGIPDAEVIVVLEALKMAPLQVIVLEGLAQAEYPLFEYIASQFPNLSGLTLVRRQNHNQHQNKHALWPHASWEYAPYLKDFTALRHFSWNLRTEYWDATPSTLLAFESNFASASRSLHDQLDFGLVDEASYLLDSHWMSWPFAAHCPSLQTYAVMDRTTDMVCRISRNPKTGTISTTPKYPPCLTGPWNVQRWNTVGSRWPPLPPFIAEFLV